MKREARKVVSAATPFLRQMEKELFFWRDRQAVLEYSRDRITDTETIEINVECSLKELNRFIDAFRALNAKLNDGDSKT